ncbi:MAG: hypothetical protein EOL95_10025 [Bacteroidia bacterium]|nr:hypothetical protein [Bacteroidia bacterium]
MKTLFKPQHLILIVVMLSLGLFTTCKKDPLEVHSNAVPETTVVIDEQTWETTYTGMDSTSKTLYFT